MIRIHLGRIHIINIFDLSIVIVFILTLIGVLLSKKMKKSKPILIGVAMVIFFMFALSGDYFVGSLLGTIVEVIALIVSFIVSKIKKARENATEIENAIKKYAKEEKTIRSSLKTNPEVIKVLEIDDNIEALARCATIFEGNVISKSEFEELVEYIKSRV